MSIRVAIAHEWLVSYAGSERCVAELMEEFPGSRLLTTVLEPEAVPEALRGAETSFLQRVPGATSHHQYLLPAMPLSWRLRRPIEDVDAVISSSHACVKAVRRAPSIPHLCYCHTPMRYVWETGLEQGRFPAPLRPVLGPALSAFRRWDRGTADRVTHFVANSEAVRARIRRTYGRESTVIHPPVRTDFFTPGDEEQEDFFLFVGRLVAYKRADLAVEAFSGEKSRLIVVGGGPMAAELERVATRNVTFMKGVSDEELRSLYRRARGLIHPAVEDFGISMAEAQSCGTPVIALADGGAADIVADGETGWLISDQTAASVRRAVRHAASADLDRPAIAARAASKFSAGRYRRAMRAATDEMVHAHRVKGALGVS